MKYIIFALFLSGANAQEVVPCDCPKVECPPCFHSEGMSFVSEKCGDGGLKTRSCSRPKCIENVATTDPKCSKPEQKTAEAAAPKSAHPSPPKEVGSFSVVKGQVQLISPDGTMKLVAKGDAVKERDSIFTDPTGSALIDYSNGNKTDILPNSKLVIQEYSTADDTKRAVFNLLKGKIRNQVKEKYDGKDAYFRIQTPGIVAGVRGTDFIVTHEEGEKAFTKVDTLEGDVKINERIGNEEADVEKGKTVTYELDKPSRRSSSDWSDIAVAGSFKPVRVLTKEELAALDRDTQLDPKSMLAKVAPPKVKVESPICKEPKGRMNQCSWKCQNNPKGSKVCDTTKPQVSCVRSRCNANGEWSEETRLPSSAGQECKADGFKVEDCDY